MPVRGDVLVLAGDLLPLRSIEEAKHAFGWFCERFPHVVFLPGNHEYYRTRPAAADAMLAACAEAFANLLRERLDDRERGDDDERRISDLERRVQ